MTRAPRQEAMRQNGAAIRLMRRTRGIKTGDLAKRVNVGRPTLTTIENNSRQAGWELLYRLARALDVPVVELLSDAGRVEHRAELTPLPAPRRPTKAVGG